MAEGWTQLFLKLSNNTKQPTYLRDQGLCRATSRPLYEELQREVCPLYVRLYVEEEQAAVQRVLTQRPAYEERTRTTQQEAQELEAQEIWWETDALKIVFCLAVLILH